MLRLERRAVAEIRAKPHQEYRHASSATGLDHRFQRFAILNHHSVLPRSVTLVRRISPLLIKTSLDLRSSNLTRLATLFPARPQPTPTPCHRSQRHRPVLQPGQCPVAVLQTPITAILQKLVVPRRNHHKIRVVTQYLEHNRPQPVTRIRQPPAVDRLDRPTLISLGQLQTQPPSERRLGRERTTTHRRSAQTKHPKPILGLLGQKLLIAEKQTTRCRRPQHTVPLVLLEQSPRTVESRQRIVGKRWVRNVQTPKQQLQHHKRDHRKHNREQLKQPATKTKSTTGDRLVRGGRLQDLGCRHGENHCQRGIGNPNGVGLYR